LIDKATYLVVYMNLDEKPWGDIDPALRYASYQASSISEAKDMCKYKNESRLIYAVGILERNKQDD